MGKTLENFESLVCRMDIKINFLKAHFEFLLRKSWESEQGTEEEVSSRQRRGIEDILEIWNVSMMADYYWMLHHECPLNTYK